MADNSDRDVANIIGGYAANICVLINAIDGWSNSDDREKAAWSTHRVLVHLANKMLAHERELRFGEDAVLGLQAEAAKSDEPITDGTSTG